jgi:hypothetical protein
MLRRVTLVRTAYFCHPDYGGYVSSETSVLAGATQRNIPEDNILYIHRVKISNLTLE